MRRTGIALIILSLTFSLTACGAGFNAETRWIKQVTDGVEGAIINDQNEIKVRNLLVVQSAENTGVIVGTIVNTSNNDDALLGLAINAQIATIVGTTSLTKDEPVIFEGNSANAKAVIPNLDVVAGQSVRITMFFARAGELTVDAIVRSATGDYASISSQIPEVTTTQS